MKKLLFLLIALPVFTVIAACGKRGPLVAPEALVPAPIKDLRVEQKGNRFLVCWSAPGKEEWGGPLKGLAGFQVFRREVLPPDEDCETCPSAYGLLRTVDPEYLQDVLRSGSFFCFFDSDLKDGRTYQYKVVTMDKEGSVSKDSNRAWRKKTAPVLPPRLAGEPAPRGVVIRWQPVVLPPGSTLEGFAVYRRQSGADVMPLFPLTVVKGDTFSFEDPQMEHGVQYFYAVRTVAGLDGERVESDLSNEVSGMFSLSE